MHPVSFFSSQFKKKLKTNVDPLMSNVQRVVQHLYSLDSPSNVKAWSTYNFCSWYRLIFSLCFSMVPTPCKRFIHLPLKMFKISVYKNVKHMSHTKKCCVDRKVWYFPRWSPRGKTLFSAYMLWDNNINQVFCYQLMA